MPRVVLQSLKAHCVCVCEEDNCRLRMHKNPSRGDQRTEEFRSQRSHSLKKQYGLQTTGHLPGQSTGVRTAREASASRSAGVTLVLRPRGRRSAGESVEHRGQQLLDRARATEPLRRRHFRLQTTCHLPGQSTGVQLLPHVPWGPPLFWDSAAGSLQAKATQLLGKILFWAFIFGQEEVQTPDNCAPP